MLNEGLKKAEVLLKEEQLRKQGITVPQRKETFEQVFMNTLTQYFDGDSETAAAFVGSLSDFESKDEMTSFVNKIANHISTCLQDGWNKKKNIDWNLYKL